VKRTTMMVLVCAVALSSTAALGQSQKVRVPSFRSADEALQWSRMTLSSVQALDAGPGKTAALQEAIGAASLARQWKDVDCAVQGGAILVTTEAFLALSSPRNAVEQVQSWPGACRGRSSEYGLALERAGEAQELAGNRTGAAEFYARALNEQLDASVRSLTLVRYGASEFARLVRYRASEFSRGGATRTAATLGEVVAGVPRDSAQGVVLRCILARSYVHLKDVPRAKQWVSSAREAFDVGGGAGSDGLPRTHVPPPSASQARAVLEATETMIGALD